MMICAPVLTAYYGTSYWSNEAFAQGAVDVLLSRVLPIIAVIVFWIKKQATPGKQMISAKIVAARTGNKPTVGQCIVRYLGYYLSAIPLCFGFIWVAFDKHKQGWHDKLAGTVVIRHAKPIADKNAMKGRISPECRTPPSRRVLSVTVY
ncbi:MAG: RDD family protein [Pararheinheimera sp.]|nr:RDD family protein [Rheinheimera sp.]